MSNISDKFFNFSWFRKDNAPSQSIDMDSLSKPQPIDFKQLKETRFVVLDLETTGLNIHKDQVIAIGAVVIQDNEIKINQSFERTLFRKTANVDGTVLIHGISPEEIASGSPPEQALIDLMTFADNSVFLAYHAPFDHGMLSRALKRDLGVKLKHTFIDVADIASAIFPNIKVGRTMQNAGLDDWVEHFKLNVTNRHNASADALATAEITLILLREAERQAIDTLAQLHEKIKGHKRLQIMRR